MVVRESAPMTTPPSKATAIMEVPIECSAICQSLLDGSIGLLFFEKRRCVWRKERREVTDRDRVWTIEAVAIVCNECDVVGRIRMKEVEDRLQRIELECKQHTVIQWILNFIFFNLC